MVMVHEVPAASALAEFSPDGKWLVIGNESEYRFHEVGSWRPRHAVAREGAAQLTGPMAFSTDGRLLAHSGRQPLLTVWDVATVKSLAKFEGHQGYVSAVAFAPDGRTVATGSGDCTVLVWDVQGLSAKAGPVRRSRRACRRGDRPLRCRRGPSLGSCSVQR